MEHDHGQADGSAVSELTIKVVHDNNAYDGTLRTVWGFSACIVGPDKTILFDTGSDGSLLLENMAKLHIEPAHIDLVALSHVHGDHTGGLTGFLKAKPRVDVYLPQPFPARFKEVVQGYGASIVEVDEPREICTHVYTTGLVGRLIKEQALVIRTIRGLVILTGCAHPGVTKMVEAVRRLSADDILLVMGGFHLEWATARKVEKIITVFRDNGVRYVAPTHCTGYKARELFQRRYGEHYIDVGAGKVLTLADLEWRPRFGEARCRSGPCRP